MPLLGKGNAAFGKKTEQSFGRETLYFLMQKELRQGGMKSLIQR